MFHTLIVAGRMTADPELKFMADGKEVCNFTLAVDVGFGDNKKTMWVRVAAWGKTAISVNEYMSKGRQLLVEGTLRPSDDGNPRVYQKSDGTSGASFEMNAQVVRFLGSKDEGSPKKAEASIPDDIVF